MSFVEMKLEDLAVSPFQMIGHDWMLIAAEKCGQVNAMTASWGGLGVMWAKNVAYIVIRPQRYTKEFVDEADSFSLTFYSDQYKRMLGYMGSVSGRDENKIERAGLTTVFEQDTPYFEEASIVMLCKKLYVQPMKAGYFIDSEEIEKWYPECDFHTLYIGEITKVYVKNTVV